MFNGRNRQMSYYAIQRSFFHNEIISFCLKIFQQRHYLTGVNSILLRYNQRGG
jgi:hypothetical protein